jgi:NAD(P)-dependent dehydrogenase (short-subunit alcohol dehydrogenase family)
MSVDSGKLPLENKTAVIAGGLGALASAAGRALLAQGCKTIALLYAPFEADKTHSFLSEEYPEERRARITLYECDITSESSVEAALEKITVDLGCCQILLNCAGVVDLCPLEETSLQLFEKHLKVNLVGPFLVSKAFAKRLIAKNEKGTIVSIASQAAHVALPEHGA